MSSGVAFAVLRRISRESVHTGKLIDDAAQALCLAARDCAGAHILVEEADQLDRPSLKVLFRAALLSDGVAPSVWTWTLQGDPDRHDDSPWGKSRQALLASMAKLLEPEHKGTSSIPIRLVQTAPAGPRASREELATDLVLQNYDRIFADLAQNGSLPVPPIDEARLIALSALNVGDLSTAEDVLARREPALEAPEDQAHLAYLQGLVAAKRHYSIDLSDRHHTRGLSHIEGMDEDSANLERGWLLNGLALNAAIRWRRQPEEHQASYKSAFAYVQRAFLLVARQEEPPAAYLRFNLIANTTFLLEMRGSFAEAARSFERMFDLDAPAERATGTLGYRIGVLWMRAGELDRAEQYLRQAEEDASGHWALHEVVLRALGCLDHERGRTAQAADHYAVGARLCLDARAARGALHHIASLQCLPDGTHRAEDLVAELIDGGISPVCLDTYQPAPPPSKLPAYIPEIDLENLPAVDLNRYLGQGDRALPTADSETDHG